ncbi:tRNA pseudouridine(38-40) synthase TruA [Arthrobacter sp. NamB2]|uniref:tRNA pseudouridine synthase A n=1 Tax=Arthrobacter sp. NamB2 TaxID=2576035 RepID=UPI0010C9EAD7|nr:tRNA pseudouridine synthase A [Arthrobacter sp. NamB2]TKV29500.1 tRNA pseudouridine(38-40) synthase TruA [Arthrobacter sp. NamB2]
MTTPKPAAPTGDGGLLRVRLDIAYDGAPFSGWALQPGRTTVQGVLEEALHTLFRRPARLTVGGRTDAGVHARGQVAHVDLTHAEWAGMPRGRDAQPADAFLRRLTGTINRALADETSGRGRSVRNSVPPVVVRAAVPAPDGFDARFSALWRRYSYAIADTATGQDPLRRHSTLWYPAPLDVGLLNEGAAHLLGMQDFTAFCKPREGATTIRELQRYEFARGHDGVITATVQADAFCHNMVRALVGSTLRVGSGEMAPGWLAERLAARVKDAQSILAAPHPLVLEEIAYPGDAELAARAELTRARRNVSHLAAHQGLPGGADDV